MIKVANDKLAAGQTVSIAKCATSCMAMTAAKGVLSKKAFTSVPVVESASGDSGFERRRCSRTEMWWQIIKQHAWW
jgi:hypothetical protein